ncbi:XdhC family protein, partial [Hymenobacter agri]
VHRREAPADRSGMMCSGEQDVLLWPLTVADLPAVAAIESSLQTLSGGWLELSPATGLQFVAPAAADATTGTQEAEDALAAASAYESEAAAFYDYQPDPAWRYRERLGFRDQLTIVGGGHVSLALSNVAAALDFELTVLDDRADLPTFDNNHAAHYRHRVDYESVAAAVPPGPHCYVVVMTVGYRTDAVVLRQLIPLPYRYLGVMGSVAKVTELRRGLREEGFSEDAIARLHGPIGLPIQSQTPEEIAISIAAELIQARRAGL